jgi:peptidoglycan/xylan/chitin deacetylase (PgdA/CDA1 family)
VRTIKLGISLFYFAASVSWQALARAFSQSRVGTAVVLYYHGVPPRYQRQFEEQMRLVAICTNPVALSGLTRLPENTHSVAITFDDAVESFAANAVPSLVRWNIPATVFAVSDQLDTRPNWGDSYYPPEERLMSADRLRGLPDLISVGSHTLTHPNLVELSLEAAALEITHSREKLESMLQRPVLWFCFPYGAFDDSTVRLCREAQYQRAFTTEPRLITGNREEFVVGRIEADPWDWWLEFRLKIMGAYCWQPWARALKRRLLGRKPSQGIAGAGRLERGANPVSPT